MKGLEILVAAGLLVMAVNDAFAQGTAFAYQGRLNENQASANGVYDFRLRLFTASSGGTSVGAIGTFDDVPVTNGLFTVIFDPGAGVFDGNPRWLEIAIGSDEGYLALRPRQLLTANPYAIRAGSVNAAGIIGTIPAANFEGPYGGVISFTNPLNTFSGNGAGLTNISLSSLVASAPSGEYNALPALNLGFSPSKAAVGDFNGDSVVDIVLSHTSENLMTILTNNHAGTFSQMLTIPYSPTSLAAADVNGDGRTDILTVRVGSGMGVWINSSSGFSQANFYPRSGFLEHIAAGDLNADGRPDFVVASRGDDPSVQVWTNSGAGFAVQTNFSFAGNCYKTALSDMNNDGKPDIVAGSLNRSYFQIMINTGTGFGSPIQTEPVSLGECFGLGDVNADGWIDIVGGSRHSNQFSYATNNHAGNVGPYVYVNVGSTNKNSIDVADIDRDGYADVVVTEFPAAVSVMLNNKAGSFTPAQTFSAPTFPFIAGITHLNQDMRLDLLVFSHTNHLYSYVAPADPIEQIKAGQVANLAINQVFSGANIFTNGANLFVGNGAGLVGLNASHLAAGTVPDARLSASVALLNRVNSFTENFYINDKDIFLRPEPDRNHGLGWYGFGKKFAEVAIDGPVVYGWEGGALGTTQSDARIALRWNYLGTVRCDLGVDAKLSLGGNGSFEIDAPGIPKGRFVVTDSGNVGIANADPTNRLMVVNARCDGNNWINSSDRNLKENHEIVDTREILARVMALPITRWNYKGDKSSQHLGPVAQDFRVAFGLGVDDTSIATVDADGVALAAIQGLNEKLEDLKAENARLKARLEKLERKLDRLEVVP